MLSDCLVSTHRTAFILSKWAPFLLACLFVLAATASLEKQAAAQSSNFFQRFEDDCRFPQLEIDATQTVHLLCVDSPSISYRRYDIRGARQFEYFLPTFGINFDIKAKLVTDDHGGAYVVWSPSYRTERTSRLYFRHIPSDTTLQELQSHPERIKTIYQYSPPQGQSSYRQYFSWIDVAKDVLDGERHLHIGFTATLYSDGTFLDSFIHYSRITESGTVELTREDVVPGNYLSSLLLDTQGRLHFLVINNPGRYASLIHYGLEVAAPLEQAAFLSVASHSSQLINHKALIDASDRLHVFYGTESVNPRRLFYRPLGRDGNPNLDDYYPIAIRCEGNRITCSASRTFDLEWDKRNPNYIHILYGTRFYESPGSDRSRFSLKQMRFEPSTLRIVDEVTLNEYAESYDRDRPHTHVQIELTELNRPWMSYTTRNSYQDAEVFRWKRFDLNGSAVVSQGGLASLSVSRAYQQTPIQLLFGTELGLNLISYEQRLEECFFSRPASRSLLSEIRNQRRHSTELMTDSHGRAQFQGRIGANVRSGTYFVQGYDAEHCLISNPISIEVE